MAHANCASDFGGMHQHCFNHGLRSFFLAYDEPSPDSRHPRSRTPPSDPRASATTTARSPPGDRRRRSPPAELPPPHPEPSPAGSTAPSGSEPPPVPPPHNADALAPPSLRQCPGPPQSHRPSVRHPPDLHRTATEYAHASASGMNSGISDLALLGLLLSGRSIFELVQKSAMAGVSLIASIGPPSSLAIELAESQGITLVGFVKDESYNLYTGDAVIVPPST